MADRTVRVRLQAAVGQYQAAMARATASTRGLSTAVGTTARSAGQQFGTLGRSASRFGSEVGLLNPKLIGGAGLVYGLQSTARAAIEWESAFAGVAKTVDGTTAQLQGLNDGLRDMSTRIPTAAEDLAGIAESAGQLGIETDAVLGFTEVIAGLGETTDLAGEQGAQALARFANITGMAQGDFDRLASSLVELGNNSATTESQIVDMAMRVAGAGSQVGMAEAEILGWSAALSSAGIQAEAGGTAISKVMIDIANEVETGGDNLTTFASTAGMSASEFSAAFREDASGAIAAFVEGLGRMEQQGGSTLGQLEELGITEVRMRDALLRLAGNSDLLNDSLETGVDAYEDNVAQQKELAKRLDTTEAKVGMAVNAWKDLQREFGDPAVPAVDMPGDPLAWLGLVA